MLGGNVESRSQGMNPRALGSSPRQRHAKRILLAAAGVCERCGRKTELEVVGCRIGEMQALCPECRKAWS